MPKQFESRPWAWNAEAIRESPMGVKCPNDLGVVYGPEMPKQFEKRPCKLRVAYGGERPEGSERWPWVSAERKKAESPAIPVSGGMRRDQSQGDKKGDWQRFRRVPADWIEVHKLWATFSRNWRARSRRKDPVVSGKWLSDRYDKWSGTHKNFSRALISHPYPTNFDPTRVFPFTDAFWKRLIARIFIEDGSHYNSIWLVDLEMNDKTLNLRYSRNMSWRVLPIAWIPWLRRRSENVISQKQLSLNSQGFAEKCLSISEICPDLRQECLTFWIPRISIQLAFRNNSYFEISRNFEISQ
jgi:hypothetical protein